MHVIDQTGQFKHDLKREAKGMHRVVLAKEFTQTVKLLALDELLSEKYRDHALSVDWKDHRDGQIKPNLVLIYCKPDEEQLQLVRFGSHSELGL